MGKGDAGTESGMTFEARAAGPLANSIAEPILSSTQCNDDFLSSSHRPLPTVYRLLPTVY